MNVQIFGCLFWTCVPLTASRFRLNAAVYPPTQQAALCSAIPDKPQEEKLQVAVEEDAFPDAATVTVRKCASNSADLRWLARKQTLPGWETTR